MPDVTLDLDDALIRRIKVIAARSDEVAKAVAVRAIEKGVQLAELRISLQRHGGDRASMFRLWLVETKGYTDGSGRTMSSLARKAVESGDPDAYIEAQKHPSTARGAVALWREYNALLASDPMSLEP